MASCDLGEVCEQGKENDSRVAVGVQRDQALAKAYHWAGNVACQMENVDQSKHMSKL